MQLGNNEIRKVGSQHITLLKQLESFDLCQNLLSGPIPAWFGKLTLSDYIQLGDNQFSGPIPGELCNIRGLKRMLIYGTRVTAISPQIGSCATVTDLVLFNNKIAGNLPVDLAKLKKLQRISVKVNQMTGALPAAIGILLLTMFDIGNNKFTGSIPANYGPFQEDELSTDFSGNMLSGPIPTLLSDLRARVFQPGNPGLCGKPLAACE